MLLHHRVVRIREMLVEFENDLRFFIIPLLMHYTLYLKLEVQSKHGDSGVTNSVLSFYFEYSADGALWKYYRVNGANKVLNSDINISILLTGLHTFLVVLAGRIEKIWYPALVFPIGS